MNDFFRFLLFLFTFFRHFARSNSFAETNKFKNEALCLRFLRFLETCAGVSRLLPRFQRDFDLRRRIEGVASFLASLAHLYIDQWAPQDGGHWCSPFRSGCRFFSQ